MPDGLTTPWSQRHRRAAQAVAAVVIVASLLVLLGWALDVPALKGVVIGLATMKPNTAIGLGCCGLSSLLALRSPIGSPARKASMAAAGVTILIGLVTLAQYVANANFGIDEFLFLDPAPATGLSFPGRPAPAAAILFILLGSACVLPNWPRFAWLSQWFTIVSAFVGYLIIAGYIFGAASLYSVGFFSSVALHTALLVVLLCFAILGLTADVGVMAHICSDVAGGVMARRLLPIVLLLPFTLGWIRVQGTRLGLYEREFGSAIFATTNVIIFSTVTLLTARALSRFDAERRSAERRLEIAVETAPLAMLMTDARGRIELVNSQLERLFGYSRAQLVGQGVEILIPEQFRSAFAQLRSGAASAGAAAEPHARELVARRADGTEFPIELGLNPTERRGELLNLIVIIDVTARKQIEEQRRLHLAELAHAARLSTVGQMMSELSHELNQPLAAAANYARAGVNIRRAGGPTAAADMADCMEKTVAQTSRAIEIVKRIGAFAKKDTGSYSPVNLNRLVENVVTLTIPTMQGPRGSQPITPRTDLDESIPEVHADRVQIEQILVNLIRNAIEAMQAPGCRDRTLLIATRRGDSYVKISVRDHGGGIPAEHLPRLFAPYFTTKSDGMGLGLSISRSIVEQHHGKMTVELTADGTEFQFTLPIPEQTADPPIRPRRASAPA